MSRMEGVAGNPRAASMVGDSEAGSDTTRAHQAGDSDDNSCGGMSMLPHGDEFVMSTPEEEFFSMPLSGSACMEPTRQVVPQSVDDTMRYVRGLAGDSVDESFFTTTDFNEHFMSRDMGMSDGLTRALLDAVNNHGESLALQFEAEFGAQNGPHCLDMLHERLARDISYRVRDEVAGMFTAGITRLEHAAGSTLDQLEASLFVRLDEASTSREVADVLQSYGVPPGRARDLGESVTSNANFRFEGEDLAAIRDHARRAASRLEDTRTLAISPQNLRFFFISDDYANARDSVLERFGISMQGDDPVSEALADRVGRMRSANRLEEAFQDAVIILAGAGAAGFAAGASTEIAGSAMLSNGLSSATDAARELAVELIDHRYDRDHAIAGTVDFDEVESVADRALGVAIDSLRDLAAGQAGAVISGQTGTQYLDELVTIPVRWGLQADEEQRAGEMVFP